MKNKKDAQRIALELELTEAETKLQRWEEALSVAPPESIYSLQRKYNTILDHTNALRTRLGATPTKKILGR